MRTRLLLLTGLMIAVFSLSVWLLTAQDTADGAMATVTTADGEDIGTLTITTQDDKVLVTGLFQNLPAGFHGFHIHGMGSCDNSGTGAHTAAGSHFNPDESDHPDHAGDLPTLLVLEDGTAYISFLTDRFTIEDLFGEHGSAIMIHANPDNFSNIPERYGEVDEETLKAGDSGDRIACGVIERMTMDTSVPVTPEGTAEMTAAPGEATAEATAEATLEVTVEVTAESTAEATLEVTAEATVEMMPTAEATAEATAES